MNRQTQIKHQINQTSNGYNILPIESTETNKTLPIESTETNKSNTKWIKYITN